jgi:hypothetical protein
MYQVLNATIAAMTSNTMTLFLRLSGFFSCGMLKIVMRKRGEAVRGTQDRRTLVLGKRIKVLEGGEVI